jgi:hypothetical protein
MAAQGHHGVLGTDYRSEELIAALCIALSVPVWSTVLLSVSNLAKLGAARAIDPGAEVPIQVTPVIDMDSPALKLGGKKVRAKMPKEWLDPEPRPTPNERTATPSTKASDDPDAIPPPELALNDGGVPLEDAGAVDDAGTASSDQDAAPSDGQGGGSPLGVDGGTTTEVTPKHIQAAYHQRILAFLRAGFSCPAVPDEEKLSCKPSASVSISGSGTVTSVSFNGCGSSAAIDAAAQASIQSKVGQSIPPPPEDYPNIMPNSFGVSYVCPVSK